MQYTMSFQVRWADVDAMGHMRHSAYNDYGAQMRAVAWSQKGFSLANLFAMEIGPVAFREETVFKREMELLQDFQVNVWVAAMRKNGKIWTMKHEFILPNGQIAATILIDGGWLHLKERKVVAPPESIFKIMDDIPKTPDFIWLPESKS